MYIRPVHAELDIPTLHDFIRANPLGLFTTAIPSAQYSTLQTTHLPFVLDPPSTETPDGSFGVLRGHIARANPQTKAILAALASSTTPSSELTDEVLILFQSPVHSYVTPKFYTETKPDTGKVVPTWNYSAVQVYGKVKVYHENNDATSAFLQTQVEDLTDLQEQTMGGKWKVGDAPKRYTDLLKKGIVGLEIKIEKIEGRFKMSQESTDGDWKGVVEGFRGLETENGKQMSEVVESLGKKRQLGEGDVGAVKPVA
ncbi:transcriptional regulator, partial [Tremellales sp. Uapishka_1]